ncbi:MAG TPA: (Fe-S)-binding protein [Polyangiaceae bacterium]|nr:(Fe-S)-binding protein [Polyangiaceae bacterium]
MLERKLPDRQLPDRRLIDECVHCGFCLPACPTYRSWGQEMDSPRGRIYLMKAHSEGRTTLGEVARHFDRCLGCLGCLTACPSGVKYDVLIEQTRAELEHSQRRSFSDRLLRAVIFAVFPYRARLRALALLAWLYERSGVRFLLRRLGVMRLLPERLENLDALAPSPSYATLRARLPAPRSANGERRRRVALLPGCVQAVYFPEVNEATVRVLAAEGCDVVVPDALGCCGALSLHAGRQEESQRFARRAIELLEQLDVDTIAVNAAGCGSTMKHWARLFDGDPAFQARAQAVAARVKDVNQLCVELGPVAPRHPLPVRVAYHDACHLAHGQGIRREPRELLTGIPGLELLEIPDADQCCGSAGVYNLLEPKSAREIGKRKADNIQQLSAELLVSANPGCTLQIQSQLRASGIELRAAHPIQLLDASIRGVRLGPGGSLVP